MFRDFKFLKRKQTDEDKEIENVHVNVDSGDTASSWSSASQSSVDQLFTTRPPLNTIPPDQVHAQNPRPDGAPRSKFERTPTKPKVRHSDHAGIPLRTPDRFGGGGFTRQRFGWGQRDREEPSGLPSVTPRSTMGTVRGTGKANSESNSTQSTPTKSVSKPSVGRPAVFARPSNGGALYKGIPVSCGGGGVNSVEVPHFELKEDPSFWMDHNVQVLIRVRPLNSAERSTNGYNRCFRQESPQTITWISQPELRFTFDHVACETIDQELLFRMAGLPMVENCLSGYNSCIFAYGQTGSGKTYTMLGEIDNLEFKPSPNRGMTPRIFEFLFARIQAEEESRRDERLKYTCKCSFLEIYNEQITDLLDPSSSNLLLREDVKTGVYVENLSEFEVHNVSDILRLLTQGSLNRKVASTNMNRESSRSHCVFTCSIESRWENDSTTNLRFARLNLVDLAGSERQKSSGAEGERLKEAANINKSLSTLGHVIMILVDVANGKHRHVPYRDSRLTFLLQDSLGGNSKTMIIANVSPSICCAAETLNTLKFAQRAKLIQNNAVVNEDSTGDVAVLQHQIRLLKDELSLLKRQNVARPLSFCSDVEPVTHDDDDDHGVETDIGFEPRGSVTLSTKQIRSLESTLAGALRREQMAETTMKNLEAEIEHLNRLVRQREEETQSIKMMLRFREDKIQRMESLVGSSLNSDAYLMEENRALSKEIQLLQAKVDKNPEVTRFALENIRLLDQLRRFQEFYEEGERMVLLDEVANLRGQLFQFVEKNPLQPDIYHGESETRLKDELNELEECRSKLSSCLEENKTLRREIHDLHVKLENLDNGRKDVNVDTAKDPLSTQHSENLLGKEAENKLNGIIPTSVVNHEDDILDLQLEVDILKIILKEERSSHAGAEHKASCLNKDLELAEANLLSLRKNFQDSIDELKETKLVLAALESQQILAIEEMEDLRKINFNHETLLAAKEHEIMSLKNQVPLMKIRDHPASNNQNEFSSLNRKLKRMQDSLEKAKSINILYQNDRAFQTSNEEEMDEVRRQAEAETAEAIVCMEEELCILQQQVHDCNLKEIQTKQAMSSLETELQELRTKISGLGEDNKRLHKKLEEQDMELRIYSEEWELLSCEMEEVLSDGQDAIADAAQQLDLITSSLPQKRIWISENVGRLSRLLSQKDMLIEELGRCLEEANTKRADLEFKVQSLRGAAMVINEAQQKECREREKEALMLKSQLTEKMSCLLELEEKAKLAELEAFRTSTCATVAFIIVNHLAELNAQGASELMAKDIQLSELAVINLGKEVTSAEEVIHCLQSEVVELRNACGIVEQKLSDKGRHTRNLEQMLEDLEHNDLSKMREKLTELSAGILSLKSCVGDASSADDFGSTCTDAGEDLRIISDSSPKIARSTSGLLDDESALGCSSDASNTALMKKEIELALESFQELKMVVIKQLDERNGLLITEKQYKLSTESFAMQLFALEAGISNFEQQFDSRIATIEQKLLSFEHSFREALTRWGQTKEVLELEIGDTKLYSVQKAAEASCIYAKFEEAQETLKEADIMLNELMVANEKTKLDKDRMKRKENRLTDERDKLIDQVQNLQSVNDLKDTHIRDMEEQYGTELMEMKNLVNELESVTVQLQKGFEESFSSMVHDFQGVETQLSDYGKLVKSWIGDIWSEIIGKDCAISVLHLCHMGVLLETVTGLNAEKSLLHHGLCESDSVIADLRKHNFKTSKELEMFRSLKEKLLVDIKGGFDRISRKEEEAGQLCGKLTSFEKRMLDLQLQEELMLQRADHMGSELAVLMEDLDLSNRNFVESLTDQDKMLQDKDDLCNSQAELFISNLLSMDVELCVMESFIEEMGLQKNASEKDLLKYSFLLENLKRELIVSNVDVELFIRNLLSKDVELCVMQSFIEEMGLQKTASEKDLLKYSSLLENLKRELIVSNVDSELEGCELLSKESEIAFLRKQVEEAQREAGKMFSMLTEHRSRITELEKQNNGLSLDIKSLNDVDLLNSTLRGELAECMETKVRMTDQIHQLEFERDKLEKDLKSNLVTLEELSCRETSMERESARSGAFLEKLKQDAILWLVDKGMQEQLLVLEEARVEVLENRVEKAQQESLNLSSRLGQSNLRNTEAEKTMKTLEEENASLQGKIGTFKEDMNEVLSRSDNNIVRCTGLLEGASSVCQRMSGLSREEGLKLIELLLQEISETSEKISCFMEEIERLECDIKELVHLNSNLDAELVRKEGIVKGLLFDLSLLQESASNSKDQKDKVEEMMASLEALEEELRLKSGELDEFVAHNQMLETRLQEKINMISNLESNYAREQESMRRCSSEILELRSQLQDALTTNYSLSRDLTEKRSSIEKLEMGLSQMCNDIDKMSQTIDSMRCELSEVTDERDRLNTEISYMKEELEKSQALAEENEAISLEAQQIAESRKTYSDEKEAEVKLLERSVQELESTINVLENQMDILKGEAERQRLQREELEVELLAVHHQMQNVKSSDTDTQRIWDEKERDLQQALRRIKDLEKDIDDMEKEISKCHAHISELNLHSEAQASEYKQKFKELEAMVEQVKPEGHFFHANSSSNKSEKHAVKSRGSGSPFKCIGLGMVQQMKLEKDEELVAARLHIEELESQAVSRQKEIFALNARLAAAESMTHDVIRDLLGVKLDMSNYASLLDNQQVQKIAEKAQFSCLEPQAKEQEVLKLKQQLNEFIEERRGWIEDIDRKQAEMIAAQTALEKLRQRDQLLQSEIEFLKMENGNYKKRVMDLEGEVKELSGQQNLQQRIHHHAKIKEENNMLKLQNEDLDAKLRRAERIMIRVKEELARYRASNGKCPYINFDEERRLMNKLKETEEDRVQLAQKLLAMCTSILKVAGITKPATEISPAVAEEALAQLNKTITSLEREIQNLLHKNRISNERIRLLEIRQQASSSPVNPRTDDNYSTPRRSQASFLSDFDR